ncbi:MAG: hypothetical protein GDA67_15800 [Nitrospira sp. CR1.3]|nr:hypothetical protein [Nitrospira sp. CR1.3]
MKPLLATGLLVALHAVVVAGNEPVVADGQNSEMVRVRIPQRAGAAPTLADMRQWRDWLMQRGIVVDRCGMDQQAGELIVELEGQGQRQALTDAGFTVVEQFEPHPLDGPLRVQSQYYDPGEIAALLDSVNAAYPEITLVFTIGTTPEGRPIRAIEISNQPGVTEDEPAIQFNGQHHAREVITSHVVMDVISQLTENYGVDSEITDWVNNYKTVCVPMVNPDGVQHVFNVYNLWRKNRKNYGGSCIGVDLNRNYPYLWGPGCGSSGTCTTDIYRGPSSISELESQAMMALADSYHFVMATSYHSYGNFIDYPYACSDGSASGQMPEHPVIHEMMIAMAGAISSVDGVTYTAYTPVPYGGVNGDDTSWYYAHRGTYAFIVEVGSSFEPAFSTVPGHITRNRAGWKYLYQRLGQARIDVYAASGCVPIEAEITLKNYVYDTGEWPRTTFLPYGRWTYVVPANGTYTVRVSKPGYVTQDVPVAVGNSPVSLHIELQPANPPPLMLGDMNLDGLVDGLDVQMFSDELVAGTTADPAVVVRGDFVPDCALDDQDVPLFVETLLN